MVTTAGMELAINGSEKLVSAFHSIGREGDDETAFALAVAIVARNGDKRWRRMIVAYMVTVSKGALELLWNCVGGGGRRM